MKEEELIRSLLGDRDLDRRWKDRTRRFCNNDMAYGGIIQKMLSICENWNDFHEMATIMSRVKYERLDEITVPLANECVLCGVEISQVIYNEHTYGFSEKTRDTKRVGIYGYITILGMDFIIKNKNENTKANPGNR